jgi:hypothetical protein
VDGAGTASGYTAIELRGHELQHITQRPKQHCLGGNIDLSPFAIRDVCLHGNALPDVAHLPKPMMSHVGRRPANWTKVLKAGKKAFQRLIDPEISDADRAKWDYSDQEIDDRYLRGRCLRCGNGAEAK